MTIDIKKIQQKLCDHLCAEVQLVQREGGVMVSTPFFFPDGDQYVVYLQERPGGVLRLTDAGHTLMHLSYENDIDKFRQGTRGKLFEQALASAEATEQDGEIYIESSPGDLGAALFRLSQTLTSITDLTFLNRERAASTFYEDLDKVLVGIVDAEKIQKDYIHHEMEDASHYPIDYCIDGKAALLFVFGIPSKDKARLSTIVLDRLLRSNTEFDSVLIFADQSAIPRADLARLSNVGGEMVSSLDAEEDCRRKIRKKVA